MKTPLAITTLAFALTTLPLVFAQAQAPRGGAAGAPQGGAAPAGAARGPAAAPMALTTTGWMDGAIIPNKFTQAVPMAVSPALTWTNAPMGTQSFVLHFHDPDVSIQRGTGDQVHWLVWNIPASERSLPEGVSQGAQANGMRQISQTGPYYRGPAAPASGPAHHYVFELYALDSTIDVPAVGAQGVTVADTRAAVLKAMETHVRGKAVIVGTYKRPAS